MTEKDIVEAFISDVNYNRSRNKIFANIYFDNFEADLLEITTSNYAYEFEVKLTKSDFKNDAKKACKLSDGRRITKYELLESGQRVNYFSYIVPRGLIKIEDVPSWAGLIYFSEYQHRRGKKAYHFSFIKPKIKLTNDKFPNDKIAKLFEAMYYKYYTLRREVKRLVSELHQEVEKNKIIV